MEIVSLCDLPVAGILWSTEQRGWSLTVMCKATFALAPDEMELAGQQLPIHDVDQHWDGEPVCSVYAPGDVVPFKPRIDIMLVGHGHAPSGTPTSTLVTRMSIGEVDKSLSVFGARVLDKEGDDAPVARFRKVPLRYERAAGGVGTVNPLGIPIDGEPDTDGTLVLPNIECLSHDDESEALAGYGPVAAGWPVRSHKLGRRGDSWRHGGWYEAPLPAEFDFSFFNAAPEDQQLDVLDSRAVLTLQNLTADHEVLVTSLPALRPQAHVEHRSGETELLTLRCDTLWVDTDRMLCTMTFRGQLRLDDPEAVARCLVTVSETGETISWLHVDGLRARSGVAPINVQGPDSLGAAIGLEPEQHAPLPAAGRRLNVRVFEPKSMSEPISAVDDEVDTLGTAEVLSAPTEPLHWLGPESKPAPLNDRGDPIKKLIWFDSSCSRRLRAHPLWVDLDIAGLFVGEGGGHAAPRPDGSAHGVHGDG